MITTNKNTAMTNVNLFLLGGTPPRGPCFWCTGLLYRKRFQRHDPEVEFQEVRILIPYDYTTIYYGVYAFSIPCDVVMVRYEWITVYPYSHGHVWPHLCITIAHIIKTTECLFTSWKDGDWIEIIDYNYWCIASILQPCLAASCHFIIVFHQLSRLYY